jgi:hypothetical protein
MHQKIYIVDDNYVLNSVIPVPNSWQKVHHYQKKTLWSLEYVLNPPRFPLS